MLNKKPPRKIKASIEDAAECNFDMQFRRQFFRKEQLAQVVQQ